MKENIPHLCRPITSEDLRQIYRKSRREKQVNGKKKHVSTSKLSFDFFSFDFSSGQTSSDPHFCMVEYNAKIGRNAINFQRNAQPIEDIIFARNFQPCGFLINESDIFMAQQSAF